MPPWMAHQTGSSVISKRMRGEMKGKAASLCTFLYSPPPSVHIFHRATSADYKRSGFDRGHLAAAANHKLSQKAMEDTFYLSNVAPQVDAWSSIGCNI